jgi:CubicO group peptidase (beta-lactamase class C family)
LTKPLATALAAAVLISRGVLCLDTRLDAVFSELAHTPKARITVEMLLRHTSGLPAHRTFFLQMAGPDPRQVLRRRVVAEPLEQRPGTGQIYSDLGYILLAWVIETVSKKRLDRFVREEIYHPLGIQNLFFMDSDKKKDPAIASCLVSTQTCAWRGKTLKGEVEDENAWAAGGIEGHAGLFGDAASIHTLACEILDGVTGRPTRVLDGAVLASFVRKEQGQDRVAGFDTPSGPCSAAGPCFSSQSIGHLGYTGTSFWIDPESRWIIILLTNRVHPSRENVKIRKFRPWIHEQVLKILG